jgi:hypothetical protein
VTPPRQAYLSALKPTNFKLALKLKRALAPSPFLQMESKGEHGVNNVAGLLAQPSLHLTNVEADHLSYFSRKHFS